MIGPGIYYGLSFEEYLAIPALSSGVAQTLLAECPYAAWFASPWNPRQPCETNDATDAGSIAHEIFLEGSRLRLAVIDPADHPNATKPHAIPTGWTNKSIRDARDAARTAGKIPILPSDEAEIDALVCAAQAFVESVRETEPAVWQAFQSEGGDSELTFVWLEGETLCKMRADRIAKDNGIVIDYKSSALSVEPNAWAKRIDYVGAAWYRRGVRAITGIDPDYIFLCGQLKPPYLHSLVGIEPAGMALGDEKVGEGIRKWQACERARSWPAYPPRVHWVALPPWEASQWAERNGVGADGLPPDNAAIWRSQ